MNGFVEWTCEWQFETCSRAARNSTVKRIGYRTKILYLKEEAENFSASNGGGTAAFESPSIRINFCYAYRGRFFILKKEL